MLIITFVLFNEVYRLVSIKPLEDNVRIVISFRAFSTAAPYPSLT